MIVWCGIKLMGTPSVSEKSAAKSCITNAILGVLLAAGSWIILNTINSQLLLSELNLGNTVLTPPLGEQVDGNDAMPTAPGWYYRYKNEGGKTKNSGRYNTSAECISVMESRKTAGDTIEKTNGVECFEIRAIPIGAGEKAVRNEICGNDSCVITKPLGINKAPCSPPDANGVINHCTNVAGMPGEVINHIKSLQSACGCDVIISGGTENGHKTHQPGNRVFDLSRTFKTNIFWLHKVAVQ
jgi:hypothetical protein